MENHLENFDSVFVNVTLSAPKIDGKYAIIDLMRAATGDWVISEEAAKKIKYVYPVRKHQVLGVFEVDGYQMVTEDEQTRARFNLKPIYNGSTPLLEKAKGVITPTNYVVKYF
jgi:hypothetical protein